MDQLSFRVVIILRQKCCIGQNCHLLELQRVYHLRSGIHYTLKCYKLSVNYQANGTTIATYKTTDGHRGNYYERLKVYNQKIDPLGYQVAKIQTADKRTTHWVPEVQK